MKRLLLSLTLLTPSACSNSDATGTASGNQTTGGAGTTSAEGGAAASATTTAGGGGSTAAAGELTDCDLPTAGASGVARPSGTPGNLEILDWAGFTGAVTYTFDDGNASQIANYEALNALGVRMTFYLVTSKTTASDPIWAEAILDGHELGNHTTTHAQTATAADIDDASTFLTTTFGVTPYTMAAPYGSTTYVTFAEERFLINRGVSNALIGPNDNTNPFNLPCYIPSTAAPASDFNAQIDSALAAGKWRVVLVHGFTGGNDGAYQAVNIEDFVAAVEYAKSLGSMWIDSMVNVGAYWRGQAALENLTETTSATGTTYSWTLPEHFPPGKCLRVTVDGGTLSQNGTELPWDDHGYYELHLDAGSVTLSE